MPDGRMLKKAISKSKSVGNLPSDSARLLYTWLIPWLDVEGRHEADPDIIKGSIFPKVKDMTPEKIAGLLKELAEANLIVLYGTNGETYLQLVKFHEHQKIDKNKEGKSKFPGPNDSGITLENSRPTLEKSSLSLSKVKLREVQVKREGRPDEASFDPLFEQFWSGYPKKVAKAVAREKFMIVARAGRIPELVKATNGYMDYLKHQRIKRNFDQEPMNPATFLMKDRWRDYIDFHYTPDL